MAKHFIKGEDGHYVEMSDKEYRAHKWRNSGCSVLLFIIILSLMKECAGGTEESVDTKDSTELVE